MTLTSGSACYEDILALEREELGHWHRGRRIHVGIRVREMMIALSEDVLSSAFIRGGGDAERFECFEHRTTCVARGCFFFEKEKLVNPRVA